MAAKTRILVVDDSTFFRKTIIDAIATDPELEVVGQAADGTELLGILGSAKPDVITLDMIMPGMDGLWALEEVMRKRPTPIVIFSAVSEPDSEITEEAFRLGVVDVLQKPQSPSELPSVKVELLQKIRGAAKIDRDKLMSFYTRPRSAPQILPHPHARQVVVLCASAGGPMIVQEILSALPEDLPAGVVVAQHMPQQFLDSFRRHTVTASRMPVYMGREGDFLRQGKVVFSPGDATLTLKRIEKGCVTMLVRGTGSIQPCIDIVLSTAAEAFGARTVGVVLSGMGRDSLQGASVVKRLGGTILVQDQASCAVYGMPKAVTEAGFADKILPAGKIANAICEVLKG